MMRLTILGGSSPFTAGLFEALAENPVARLSAMMLYGRDGDALRLLARHAAARLPDVTVSWTTDMDAATDGYDVVLHQIRYGGLEGRARGEAAARDAGQVADETMGPAALQTACAMRGPLLHAAECIARNSPRAHVINLTNPLGLAMALLHRGGIADPIGVCELPLVSAHAAADAIGVPYEKLRWAYSGLNHRGFLHALCVDGEDVLEDIAARVGGDGVFGGLGREALVCLGGLPTKYFTIFATGEAVSAPGRAEKLMGVRRAILTELARDCRVPPPSLAARPQPWWKHAVVPLLRALSGETQSQMILNLMRPGKIAREGWCAVSRRGARWTGSPPPPPAIAEWITRFAAHEDASLRAVLSPSPQAFARAMALDPARKLLHQ